MRWAVAACALYLGLSAPSGAQPALRRDVESRFAELIAAFMRGDPQTVARMFTDDASIIGPNGLRVVGRAAVDSYWVARPRPTSWTVETFEVGGTADSPWQYARSTRISTTPARSDTTFATFIIIWKRGSDGKLRIYLDLFT